MSDSLRPHELQHARPPCPSPTPGVHSDSHPSSQWCHPAISSSVVPFSSCPQSLPASESFPMSQLFTWSGQSTGVSALASFLPKKSQGNSTTSIKILSNFFFWPASWHAGSQLFKQGSKPCPLHWKHGVLTTGLPGNFHNFYSRSLCFYFSMCSNYTKPILL